MALIPPFTLDCVVAVGFASKDGKIQYTATGLLYGQFLGQVDPDRKTYRVFLVTSRHVLEEKTLAYLRFNPHGAEPAREYSLPLVESRADGGSTCPLWTAHPDSEVDVAAIPLNAPLLLAKGMQFSWFRSDQHTAACAQAEALGIVEGNGVFVLGFPMGLIGEQRNFVVVRQGIIARIRDCYAGRRKEFLIDCTIFPGNSGGPVVTRPETTAIQGTQPVRGAFLIGVVAGYVPYQDIAISKQTNRPRVIFEENSGLASVYPIDAIEAVISRAAEQAASCLPEETIAVAAQ